MKCKYKTMKFEQDGSVWYGKSDRCIGSVICIMMEEDDDEWMSEDTICLTAAEHRDIADFLEQLNKGNLK